MSRESPTHYMRLHVRSFVSPLLFLCRVYLSYKLSYMVAQRTMQFNHYKRTSSHEIHNRFREHIRWRLSCIFNISWQHFVNMLIKQTSLYAKNIVNLKNDIPWYFVQIRFDLLIFHYWKQISTYKKTTIFLKIKRCVGIFVLLSTWILSKILYNSKRFSYFSFSSHCIFSIFYLFAISSH